MCSACHRRDRGPHAGRRAARTSATTSRTGCDARSGTGSGRRCRRDDCADGAPTPSPSPCRPRRRFPRPGRRHSGRRRSLPAARRRPRSARGSLRRCATASSGDPCRGSGGCCRWRCGRRRCARARPAFDSLLALQNPDEGTDDSLPAWRAAPAASVISSLSAMSRR